MKLASELNEIDVIFEVLSDEINKYDVVCEKVVKDFGFFGKPKNFISVNNGKRTVYFKEEASKCEESIQDIWGFEVGLRTVYKDTHFFTTYEEALSYFEKDLKRKELVLNEQLELVRNNLSWINDNREDSLENKNLFMK
jgi:hypothetical protein